jgi:hypothetical protein
MNRELQDYYEERFSMMASKGWKDLVEDLELMLDNTNTLAGVDTEQQLWFRKGEISIMTWLKNLRESSTEVYEQLQKEEENATTDV